MQKWSLRSERLQIRFKIVSFKIGWIHSLYSQTKISRLFNKYKNLILQLQHSKMRHIFNQITRMNYMDHICLDSLTLYFFDLLKDYISKWFDLTWNNVQNKTNYKLDGIQDTKKYINFGFDSMVFVLHTYTNAHTFGLFQLLFCHFKLMNVIPLMNSCNTFSTISIR